MIFLWLGRLIANSNLKSNKSNYPYCSGDNEPVEFLVDFNAKRREEEKQRLDDAEKAKNEESEAVHFNPNEGISIVHMLFCKVVCFTKLFYCNANLNCIDY